MGVGEQMAVNRGDPVEGVSESADHGGPKWRPVSIISISSAHASHVLQST